MVWEGEDGKCWIEILDLKHSPFLCHLLLAVVTYSFLVLILGSTRHSVPRCKRGGKNIICRHNL